MCVVHSFFLLFFMDLFIAQQHTYIYMSWIYLFMGICIVECVRCEATTTTTRMHFGEHMANAAAEECVTNGMEVCVFFGFLVNKWPNENTFLRICSASDSDGCCCFLVVFMLLFIVIVFVLSPSLASIAAAATSAAVAVASRLICFPFRTRVQSSSETRL